MRTRAGKASAPVEVGDYWIEPTSIAGNTERAYAPEPDHFYCPIRFQGQWEDAETGLNYNYKRYYDPVLAVYFCPDPIGIFGGLRNVAYVKTASTSIDPFGLTPLMRSVTNRSGGQTWVSNNEVCQNDFSDIVDELAQTGPVTIVTGTHGVATGEFFPDLRERDFYLDDLERWGGNQNVTVLDAFELTEGQMNNALNQPNSIAAWCYSDRDVRVTRAIGCCSGR